MAINKKQIILVFVILMLVSTTCFSIFSYNYNFFNRRTDALPAEQVDNIYKVFSFLGGSVV